MQAYEHYLSRWSGAGLLDEATASSIRNYEATQATPAGRRWQVVIALLLGGILLGAGVLLFVAAHWDDVSPIGRLALVLGMLAAFHIAGIATRERFSGFATTMHALGTVASGAAIALVGQIFNMQEHWPAAIMLWALCAAAGWWLLRDEFQQTLTLLLVPAWLVCEWSYRAEAYNGSEVYLFRMIAVIAAVYLTAFLHSRRRAVFGILFGISALALVIATVFLSEGWSWHYGLPSWGSVPAGLQFGAYLVMALALAFAWILDRRALLPASVVTAMTLVLPWLHTIIHGRTRSYTWDRPEPMVTMYAVVALTCVFLAWWGVREASKAIVNYGIAAFALTVMWFYFSDVMGKLDRSLGLILLGVLFLAGGWALEQMRRRLVASFTEVAA
jgi:uncharacterized membrane protein